MGCCLSTPAVAPSPSCSPEEKERYEWLLRVQEHRINRLRMRLRQWEESSVALDESSGNSDAPFGKTALCGVAQRYDGSGGFRDTRQVIRDLAVLNYYLRQVLDNLACVPERRVPRVRFE